MEILKKQESWVEGYKRFQSFCGHLPYLCVSYELIGITLDSRMIFYDADARGYQGQEATEVGLFNGVMYTVRFKMGEIVFD